MSLLGKIVFTIIFVILLIWLAYFLYKKLSFMNNFQKIVTIIAIIVLLALLFIIAIIMKNSHDQTWPPVIGDCPDYWVDTSGNGRNCINVKNLGTCPSNVSGQPLSMNFSGANYQGSSGLCNKYNYASGCGLTWDGITYGGATNNPCD